MRALGRPRAPTWVLREAVVGKDYALPAGAFVCPIQPRNVSKEIKKSLDIYDESYCKDHIVCYTSIGMILIPKNYIEEAIE